VAAKQAGYAYQVYARSKSISVLEQLISEYVPTADQRALVENAAAFGLTQADIAEQLKINEKTLRDELSSGKFKVDMTAGNWHGRDRRARHDLRPLVKNHATTRYARILQRPTRY
jgi:hypothetical protein